MIALGLIAPALAAAQTSKSRDWVPSDVAKQRMQQNAAGTRIIGGTDSNLKDNPWQVALLYASDPDSLRAQNCGGTVIGRRWVLTAAHCVDKLTKDDIHVLAGSANLRVGGHRFKVDKVLVHEDWSRDNFRPDIALLRVKPEPGRSLGTPIELHLDPLLDSNPPGGDIMRITGWGVTENRTDGTEQLKGVEIPIVKHGNCRKTVVYGTRIDDNVFCAGRQDKDTCRGDSGGPSTMMVGGTRKLAGITSWGEGCGESDDKPGVYTNVARFVDWTEKKIAANGGH